MEFSEKKQHETMVGSPTVGGLSDFHKPHCQQKAWSLFRLLPLLFPGVHMLLRVDAASLLPKGALLFPAMVFWNQHSHCIWDDGEHFVFPRIRELV